MFESTSATATSAWFRVLQATAVVEMPVEDSQSIALVVGTPSWFGALCLLFFMVFLSLAIHYDCIEELAPCAANRPKCILYKLPDKF
jgi:hypothetical protein